MAAALPPGALILEPMEQDQDAGEIFDQELTGGSSMTLGRQGPDSASLIREITIRLGMELAHGDFSADPG